MNRISRIRLEAALLAAAALAAPLLLNGQNLNDPILRGRNLEEALASVPVLLPTQTQQAQAEQAKIDQAGPAPPQPAEPETESNADALLGRRQYQAAIAAYELAPLDRASVWNKMGIAYEMLYDNTAARRCYEKARRLEPKNAAVINNIGSLEMADRNYGKAEKFYRRAIRLDPRSPLFYKNLGTAYISARKYKKGWVEYRAALAIDPMIFSGAAGLRVANPTNLQDRGAMNFYMAKGCLLAGEKLQAIAYLRMALNEGFTSPKKLVEDNEFAALRALPAFQELIESEAQTHPTTVR